MPKIRPYTGGGGGGGQSTDHFPFVFMFGDNTDTPVAGAKIAIPVPATGTFVAWQARVAGDVVGSALFALRVALTPTGALASVGGTQPELVAVKGRRETVVDWGTVTVLLGGILECEYVSGNISGVTLLVEYG